MLAKKYCSDVRAKKALFSHWCKYKMGPAFPDFRSVEQCPNWRLYRDLHPPYIVGAYIFYWEVKLVYQISGVHYIAYVNKNSITD